MHQAETWKRSKFQHQAFSIGAGFEAFTPLTFFRLATERISSKSAKWFYV